MRALKADTPSFHALPPMARAYVGAVVALATRTDAPTIYAVIALDGQALGKMLTATFRKISP